MLGFCFCEWYWWFLDILVYVEVVEGVVCWSDVVFWVCLVCFIWFVWCYSIVWWYGYWDWLDRCVSLNLVCCDCYDWLECYLFWINVMCWWFCVGCWFVRLFGWLLYWMVGVGLLIGECGWVLIWNNDDLNWCVWKRCGFCFLL